MAALDDIGYLPYDAHATDLFSQIIRRRYRQLSITVIWSLIFKNPNAVSPDVSSAALADRMTEHAEIMAIDRDSYRPRDAEPVQ